MARGGVLDLLAARVGPAGRLVGVEADPAHVAMATKFAAGRGLGNVEALTADARGTGLPSGSFDVVHARTLLVTAPEPDGLASTALTRLCRCPRTDLHPRSTGNALTYDGTKVAEIIYDKGAWASARAPGLLGPALPAEGTHLTSLVETAWGATVGETVAQVELQDQAEALKAANGNFLGHIENASDDSIFFVVHNTVPNVVKSTDRVSLMEEDAGSC